MDEVKEPTTISLDELTAPLSETERDDIARMWLNLMKKKLKAGTINATESSILMRVMIHSGYSLDPTRVPKELQDKITESLDLNDPATAEELGIIPMRRGA